MHILHKYLAIHRDTLCAIDVYLVFAPSMRVEGDRREGTCTMSAVSKVKRVSTPRYWKSQGSAYIGQRLVVEDGFNPLKDLGRKFGDDL